MFHPYNEEGTKKRLLWEFRHYPNFIIGFDFDNTVRKHPTGEVLTEVVELLQRCSEIPKFQLCMWSICTDEENLIDKLQFCKEHNIRVDFVNDSPRPYGDNRKAYFNILLDDRAGLESAYNCLKYVVDNADN